LRESLLIYGAAGYTGRMIVEQAVSRGLRPILAGRDPAKLAPPAAAFGLPSLIARVEAPEGLREMASSAKILLNAAGPFTSTAPPLIEACLATGTHYLDITGDPRTIEPIAGRHDDAVRRGVMLMPAVGFDVVASDCLLAHVARRLPGTNRLRLGFDESNGPSLGSLKTTFEMSGQGVLVRCDGRMERVVSNSHWFDYGRGPELSLAVNLGDVSSAYFSTGVPNIETFMRATPSLWGAMAVNQYWGWLLAMPPWQEFAKTQLQWLARNPSAPAPCAGWGVLVAEATDTAGSRQCSRFYSGDVYRYTALSSIGVVEKCLAGEFKPGFRTPSAIYGPDFALSFEGARREDL
jgi:short subunit dehydrogenase-like uncharacterized protein